MSIGERIIELIHKKGITQKEFSERTGISQSTISDWRRKKMNPVSDKIAIICDVLEVDPYYLISGTGGTKYEKTDYLIVYKDSDEYPLLLEYRNLSEQHKQRLMGYVDALRDMEKKV